MTDLSSLIERIEKSEGADRVNDVLIGAAVRWLHPDGQVWLHDWRGDFGPMPRMTGRIAAFHDNGDPAVHWEAPNFTASLDAAMTLVPTGWIVEIRRYFNNDGEFVSAVSLTDSFTVGRGCDPEEEVTVSSRIVERRQGIDPTPLALCACALKARNPSQ